MTSMSMETDFPPSSTWMVDSNPYGWKPQPSKDLRVVGERLISREPMALQQDKDMTDVEAPSSKMVRWRVFLEFLVAICKAN